MTEIQSEEAGSIHGGRENFVCGAIASDSFKSQVEEVISPHLNKKDKHKLKALLNDFADLFDDQITECTITKHKITLGIQCQLSNARAGYHMRIAKKRNVKLGKC